MSEASTEKSPREIARLFLEKWEIYASPLDAIELLIKARDERAALIAEAVENEWLENARNAARANDLVGGLAQSTYTNYAEVAGKIASTIRGKQ